MLSVLLYTWIWSFSLACRSHLSGGMVGMDMTGTDDLFFASSLRAFFIFCRDSSRAVSPAPPGVLLGVVLCLLTAAKLPLGRDSGSTTPPGVCASQNAVFCTSTGPESIPPPAHTQQCKFNCLLHVPQLSYN